MRILVDGVDVSGRVLATGPVRVERVLGERARCSAELLLQPGEVAPGREARVRVLRADGAELFAGDAVSAPVAVYAGEASEGAVRSVRLVAMGDVASLDTAVFTGMGGDVGARHVFADGDAAVRLTAPAVSASRELANDVTLSGAVEPAAYVTECFVGDGTTSVFALRSAAYRPADRVWLSDDFDVAAFDVGRWTLRDPGAHLSPGGAGLVMSGGTGADGATVLEALETLELGGSVVVELSGVVFGAGSDGVLAGLYGGTMVRANCFAGWHVRQQAAQTVLVAIVNGAETGTVFTPLAGHRYTLRLRVQCAEMHRVRGRYSSLADGVVTTFGEAGAVDAPVEVSFELRDEGVSSSTPVTVLYDSVAAGLPVGSAPALCGFAAVNAVSMFGSVARVRVVCDGPMLVSSTSAAGARAMRPVGGPNEGVDCAVSYGSSTGANAAVTFFAGRVPEAGERVEVRYRRALRAVARVADVARVAAQTAAGSAGTGVWRGAVTVPAARTTEDCVAAARALLNSAGAASAGCAGELACTNPASDVQAGDAVSFCGREALVRAVTLVDGASEPETIGYTVAFANSWAAQQAAQMGVRVTDAVAEDALLPAVALSSAVAEEVLANLQQLAVTTLSGTVLGIDAGVVAPSGGGFEVRTRDHVFGDGVDAASLVLRSPVRGFAVPRGAQVERIFVRMYDASVPRRYSRWSSVVAVNAPVA